MPIKKLKVEVPKPTPEIAKKPQFSFEERISMLESQVAEILRRLSALTAEINRVRIARGVKD